MTYLHERLLAATIDPHAVEALRAVVELHAPQMIYPSGGSVGKVPLCFGCELGGHGAEHPEWPCGTVKVIARELQVNLAVGFGETYGASV